MPTPRTVTETLSHNIYYVYTYVIKIQGDISRDFKEKKNK